MSNSSLFSPLLVGALQLKHRIVMAPLTRMRSTQPGNIPSEMNARYYAQRATPGGLLITEATQVSQTGKGYPATPGIHSPEQVAGWRLVTDAVHKEGGLIFLQLWHVGRISHRSHQPDGAIPVAPSAIAPAGKAVTAPGEKVPFETPRALHLGEIPSLVAEYYSAARNALAAGFDGVELHAANGYLLDQFLRDNTNKRTDRYGGSFENRARLLLEVLEAVGEVFGLERVGIRLSPLGTFNDMHDSDPVAVFSFVLRALAKKPIAYVHLIASAPCTVRSAVRRVPTSDRLRRVLPWVPVPRPRRRYFGRSTPVS